jgi:hypothetical protein
MISERYLTAQVGITDWHDGNFTVHAIYYGCYYAHMHFESKEEAELCAADFTKTWPVR